MGTWGRPSIGRLPDRRSPQGRQRRAAHASTVGVSVAAVVVLGGLLLLVRLSSPETVVLEWAFGEVLDFGRWAADYLARQGIELGRELLEWLREQWERFADRSP